MPPIPKRRNHAANRHKMQKPKTSRGLVRIIAGKHRGRRIPVLVHDGLRPTGDRVKETLFNWLMAEVPQATCLDMYAGSGGLGIEALSRGANKVVFIEQDKTVCQQISINLTSLKETENGELKAESALNADLSSYKQAINIVFIDPPFGNNMVQKSIEKLLNDDLLSANALIYIEVGHNDTYQIPTQFSLLKQIKTSQVFACLFQYQGIS